MHLSENLPHQNMFSARRNLVSVSLHEQSSNSPMNAHAAVWQATFKPEELLGTSTVLPKKLTVLDGRQDNTQPGHFYLRGWDTDNKHNYAAGPFDEFADMVVRTPVVTDDKSHVEIYQTDRGGASHPDNSGSLNIKKTIPHARLEEWKKEGLENSQGKLEPVVFTALYKDGDLQEVLPVLPAISFDGGSVMQAPWDRGVDVTDIDTVAREYASFRDNRLDLNRFVLPGDLLDDDLDNSFQLSTAWFDTDDGRNPAGREMRLDMSSSEERADLVARERMNETEHFPLLNEQDISRLNYFLENFNLNSTDPEDIMAQYFDAMRSEAPSPDGAHTGYIPSHYRQEQFNVTEADEFANATFSQIMNRDNDALQDSDDEFVPLLRRGPSE